MSGATPTDQSIRSQPSPDPGRMYSGFSKSENEKPDISVIVTTYLRPDYIVGAVRSVFGSGLAASQLDVIVTKGYSSSVQDDELNQLGARVMFDPQPSLGQQLWHAVSLARAPLIAFLDDDDLYEAARLKQICQVLRAHPDVGFYRNRVILIDPQGNPVPRGLYGALEADPYLDRTGPLEGLSSSDSASYRALRECRPWFNLSSMVVRRELLTGPFGHLLESADAAPDTRLYLIALLSGTTMYIDDRRLTQYRTSQPTWTQLAQRAWREVASLKESIELAERFARPPWPAQFRKLARQAERRALWSDVVSRIEQRRPRVELIVALRKYYSFLMRHPREIQYEPTRLFYWICAGIYLVKPFSGTAILENAFMTPSISRTRRRVSRGDSRQIG